MSESGNDPSPLKPDADWYYDPTKWWVKFLRFLHLLEDELVQVSHTGIMMWATTFNNIHGLLTSTNAVTVGGGILANIAALWGHTAKRGQVLQAKENK